MVGLFPFWYISPEQGIAGAAVDALQIILETLKLEAKAEPVASVTNITLYVRLKQSTPLLNLTL